jgi:hypothetical protein
MEWISVNDKLPGYNINEFILLLKHKKVITGDCLYKVIIWDSDFSKPFVYDNFEYRVTHWMPLPRLPFPIPPKEIK